MKYYIEYNINNNLKGGANDKDKIKKFLLSKKGENVTKYFTKMLKTNKKLILQSIYYFLIKQDTDGENKKEIFNKNDWSKDNYDEDSFAFEMITHNVGVLTSGKKLTGN